mmetsp:Transcript_386/g.1063  ORF Transcript_386/g.1063 Transcript_386/m.1063 type:complete len:219 (-) Transcript_386:1962-2618(-)
MPCPSESRAPPSLGSPKPFPPTTVGIPPSKSPSIETGPENLTLMPPARFPNALASTWLKVGRPLLARQRSSPARFGPTMAFETTTRRPSSNIPGRPPIKPFPLTTTRRVGSDPPIIVSIVDESILIPKSPLPIPLVPVGSIAVIPLRSVPTWELMITVRSEFAFTRIPSPVFPLTTVRIWRSVDPIVTSFACTTSPIPFDARSVPFELRPTIQPLTIA